jgi:hypothetical protein
MDQAVQDLHQSGITVPGETTVNTFRVFLIAKPDGAGRAILDLSAWTPYYSTPSMRLYSAAEVLATLKSTDYMIKIDLKSGFYHFRIQQEE